MPRISSNYQGIRIIDLSTFNGTSFCCYVLSDFGAEVIRLELRVGAVDRELGPFASSGENLLVAMYN